MILVSNLRLLKICFPKSWGRKLPLLFFPADVIRVDGKPVAISTTFRKRIILLGVHPDHRRKGFASQLIRRSNAVKTDTYLVNQGALEVWTKNGFSVKEVVDSPFGKKYILIRKPQDRSARGGSGPTP